jgi:hypothetical protein
MSDFNLQGKTKEEKGKWGCELSLVTPDGQVTKIESGFVFGTAEEASLALQFKIDELLESFGDDVEVVDRQEGILQ